MSIVDERDSTKSIAWLSLDSETQRDLTKLCRKYNIKHGEERESLQKDLYFKIHNHLGLNIQKEMSVSFTYHLREVARLASVSNCTGLISEVTSNYMKKFNTILDASHKSIETYINKKEGNSINKS